MLRVACLLTGLLMLGALVLVATQRVAPGIEADIAARAAMALADAGVDGARIAMNGRDLTVTGVARDPAARAALTTALAGLAGVRTVDARLGTSAADRAADTPAWLVLSRADGELTMTGAAADRTLADGLSAGALARFPADLLVDELTIGSGPAVASQAAVAMAGLEALGFLERGRLAIGQDSVRLEGLAASPSGRARAMATLQQAVPAGFEVEAQVEIPESSQSAATCQTALDELLTDGIEFAPGAIAIDAASLDLLDQVARVLLACPGLDVRVQAHTDSGGDEADNLSLTQQRANEVRRHLVAAGVPANRVAATGMGSSQPRADNATRSGRSANRRIEILVHPVTDIDPFSGQPT